MRQRLSAVRATENYLGDTRAAAAVELALTMPFFLIFIAVIIETAVFFFATSAVEQGMFNYSRKLTAMTRTARTVTLQAGVDKDLYAFVSPYLVKSFLFEIGPATAETDFTKELKSNRVIDFTKDKTKPVYLRVVAERQSYTYKTMSFVWNAISPKPKTGLFSPIDILVVIPFPIEEQP